MATSIWPNCFSAAVVANGMVNLYRWFIEALPGKLKARVKTASQYVAAFVNVLVYAVVHWTMRYWRKFRGPSPVRYWLGRMHNATTFEEWEEAAQRVDALLDLNIWRQEDKHPEYDYRLIHQRMAAMKEAHDKNDLPTLFNLLRSGLIRNLGNITSKELYNGAFAGTKDLIEDYIGQFLLFIDDIVEMNKGPYRVLKRGRVPFASLEDSDTPESSAENKPRDTGELKVDIPPTEKVNLFHGWRQTYGRTALVLQGGSLFGFCHLGVVKALFLRGLLPRVIVGTATGAIMAALVAVHSDDDLLQVLKGESIDLSAFKRKNAEPSGDGWLSTTWRRLKRYVRKGHFLDSEVLEKCVRDNIGDVTFQEAYERSKRVLNITVVTDEQDRIPRVLNYLNAPNVVIWSAAVASNVSSGRIYGPNRGPRILCKDKYGRVVPWRPMLNSPFFHYLKGTYQGRNAPLQRMAELFGVNHFVISQARPYLLPFLRPEVHGPQIEKRQPWPMRAISFALKLGVLEMRYRLRQLDRLGVMPLPVRRFLVDEDVPGDSLTLVPSIELKEFVGLLGRPTAESINDWILKGERSVWPSMTALEVRLAIEMKLDMAYERVRKEYSREVNKSRRKDKKGSDDDGLSSKRKKKGSGDDKKKKGEY